MVKAWHVFVFALIPLALVMTGVIVGSIHFEGGDSQAEIFETAEEPQSRIIIQAPQHQLLQFES